MILSAFNCFKIRSDDYEDWRVLVQENKTCPFSGVYKLTLDNGKMVKVPLIPYQTKSAVGKTKKFYIINEDGCYLIISLIKLKALETRFVRIKKDSLTYLTGESGAYSLLSSTPLHSVVSSQFEDFPELLGTEKQVRVGSLKRDQVKFYIKKYVEEKYHNLSLVEKDQFAKQVDTLKSKLGASWWIEFYPLTPEQLLQFVKK